MESTAFRSSFHLKSTSDYFYLSPQNRDNILKKSQNMTECVPVPTSEHVAEIVGRQGCKIKALRNKTNTYIKTPVRGEKPVFLVTGRKKDVENAKREILSAAEHFSSIRPPRKIFIDESFNITNIPLEKKTIVDLQPQLLQNLYQSTEQVTIQVRVPFRVVGLVVGAKGATIKHIQQDTQTYIVTPSRESDPVFEVTGTPANVQSAQLQIRSHIALRTGNGTGKGNINLNYKVATKDCTKKHSDGAYNYQKLNIKKCNSLLLKRTAPSLDFHDTLMEFCQNNFVSSFRSIESNCLSYNLPNLNESSKLDCLNEMGHTKMMRNCKLLSPNKSQESKLINKMNVNNLNSLNIIESIPSFDDPKNCGYNFEEVNSNFIAALQHLSKDCNSKSIQTKSNMVISRNKGINTTHVQKYKPAGGNTGMNNYNSSSSSSTSSSSKYIYNTNHSVFGGSSSTDETIKVNCEFKGNSNFMWHNLKDFDKGTQETSAKNCPLNSSFKLNALLETQSRKDISRNCGNASGSSITNSSSPADSLLGDPAAFLYD